MKSEDIFSIMEANAGGVLLTIIGIFIAVVWIGFPFIVRRKLNDLLTRGETISKQLQGIETTLAKIAYSEKPDTQEPPVDPPSVVRCRCNTCSRSIKFDSIDFDPRNPAKIACPHCGIETTLYLPAQPVGK